MALCRQAWQGYLEVALSRLPLAITPSCISFPFPTISRLVYIFSSTLYMVCACHLRFCPFTHLRSVSMHTVRLEAVGPDWCLIKPSSGMQQMKMLRRTEQRCKLCWFTCNSRLLASRRLHEHAVVHRREVFGWTRCGVRFSKGCVDELSGQHTAAHFRLCCAARPTFFSAQKYLFFRTPTLSEKRKTSFSSTRLCRRIADDAGGEFSAPPDLANCRAVYAEAAASSGVAFREAAQTTRLY